MGKWSNLAAQIGSKEDCANSADSADSPPNGTNGTNGTVSLPAVVIMGLRRLAAMRCPKGVDPDYWVGLVTDSQRLSDEGWAAQAIALGWSPLHLWGWSIDRDGLAVMLNGRRIVVLDAARAMIDNGPQSTALYNVRDMPADTKLLWELGK